MGLLIALKRKKLIFSIITAHIDTLRPEQLDTLVFKCMLVRVFRYLY
jgi:hypothetical protein